MYFTELFPCKSLSKCGAQDVSLYTHAWRPSLGYVGTVSLAHTLQLNVVNFSSSPQVDAVSLEP